MKTGEERPMAIASVTAVAARLRAEGRLKKVKGCNGGRER